MRHGHERRLGAAVREPQVEAFGDVEVAKEARGDVAAVRYEGALAIALAADAFAADDRGRGESIPAVAVAGVEAGDDLVEVREERAEIEGDPHSPLGLEALEAPHLVEAQVLAVALDVEVR